MVKKNGRRIFVQIKIILVTVKNYEIPLLLVKKYAFVLKCG